MRSPQSLRRRLLGFAVAVVAATSAFSGIAGAEASTSSASASSEILARLNGRRAAVGLPSLVLAPEATAVAQRWAEAMAAAGGISHRSDLTAGMPTTWVRLGENVGTGPTVDDIHVAFVASPTHDANIVDAGFTSVGIGVAEVGGRLFVAQEFLTKAAAAPATARRVVVRAPRRRAAVRSVAAPVRRRPAPRRVL